MGASKSLWKDDTSLSRRIRGSMLVLLVTVVEESSPRADRSIWLHRS